MRRMMMRTMVYMCLAVALVACAVGDGVTDQSQAIAGPGGVTVSPRDAGQLAVSWSADGAAAQYRVFRSQGAGAALVATVFDSGGGSPSTSYIDTGLAGSTSYCYAIQSTYPGGAASDIGAPGCGLAADSIAAPAQVLVISAGSSRGTTLGTPSGPDVVYQNDPRIVYPISGLAVGSAISAVSATLTDSVGTRYQILFTDGAGGDFLGLPSAGDGSPQTLTMPFPTAATIQANSNPAIILLRLSGSGTLTAHQGTVSLQ